MRSFDDVKLFLLDMDGTFYLGDRLIDGSLSFIDRVQKTGRDFLFLTNNSSHNAAFYVERLHRMGLDVPRSKILTSGEATCEDIPYETISEYSTYVNSDALAMLNIELPADIQESATECAGA